MVFECYSKMSKLYEKLGETDSSVEFLNKLVRMHKEENDDRQASKAHERLVLVHFNNGNSEQSNYHLEALQNIAEQEEDPQL